MCSTRVFQNISPAYGKSFPAALLVEWNFYEENHKLRHFSELLHFILLNQQLFSKQLP